MAKKKDITRNPPSWLEKGLFITVILIIIAIAFPIFWRLNESTRQFYECVNLQNELQQCINDWKEETGAGKFDTIPVEELRAIIKSAQFPVMSIKLYALALQVFYSLL